jgi:hypothetical protein
MTDVSSKEELLEFLYACPVGLIECDAAGEVVIMNPARHAASDADGWLPRPQQPVRRS